MNLKSFLKKEYRFVGTAIILVSVFFAYTGILPITVFAIDQSSLLNQAQNDRAVLEAELASLEAEIAQKENELKSQQGQSVTLANVISTLKTKIDKAKLNIQAKNLVISKLSGEITDKTQTIETLSAKIDSEKESLAQLIRKTNEIDQANFISILLSDNDLSSFYSDLDSFSSIKSGIKASVDQIQGVKTQTETEKKSLENKQNQELDAKAALLEAQRQVEKNQTEQKQLLALSKQKATVIAQDLADKQAKAGQLRARIFSLAGGATAIQFGDAVTYAEIASAKTGVRPAFLLAILQQETGIGANQGSCYLSVPETGQGVSVKTGAIKEKVMKPTRDVAPFLQITKALGLDPFKTIVSCPQSIGYGGAMGPSQFIPSTWALLEKRIADDLGIATPNPWLPRDAFTASAIYLSDLGASAQTYTSERNAACRYYGGGTKCTTITASYGNNVMALATKMQDDIDYLKQYGVSKR